MKKNDERIKEALKETLRLKKNDKKKSTSYFKYKILYFIHHK